MAPEYIWHHLVKRGQSTVSEIATAKGYCNDHIRRVARDLIGTWGIQGKKIKPVPSYRLDGQWVVLAGDRDAVLNKLDTVAPHLAEQARAQSMSLDEIHNLVGDHASTKGVVEHRWEFWIEPKSPALSSQTQSSSSSTSD